MKIIIKTYKYKLKTNLKQEVKITSYINTCRAVYNLALETKTNSYQTRKVSLSKYDLIKQLPALRKEFDWIKEVPAASLQAVIENLDKTYKAFFNGNGFPKFQKKDRYKSITFKNNNDIKIIGNSYIKLPKIGKIKYFNSRNIPNDRIIKTVTVTKEVDGYYISVCVKQKAETMYFDPKSDNQAIGLDAGVNSFYALSNGELKENPKFLKSFEKQLRVEQRSLSRKIKRSNNWYKQLKKVKKLHLKISRCRNNFSQVESTALIKRFGRIAIEDLKLKNMTKSSKGNIEKPGQMVKQKSGLNKVLLDVAIGGFFEKLVYKSEWYGRELVKVNPKNTSRTCNSCGYISKDNRKSQAFKCVSCGYKNNADINAAKNILVRAEPMYVNVGH